LNIHAGAWYAITPNPLDLGVTLSNQDCEMKAEPSYMAFDIECTKAPLKFPDAKVDTIFMISYMVDGKGYLILSRDISLCTIIPMGPEDVLCKKDPLAKSHNGHLLEAETYIGGKVECLETGVYRSDIEYDFDLKPHAFQMLMDNIDQDLTFAIEVELGS